MRKNNHGTDQVNPGVRYPRPGPTLRRSLNVLALVVTVAIAIVLLLNVRGWRARLQSRLLRTENWPVIVSPPASFQPQVPPGFTVSILARGFTQPRWLAVATNGDVFVADCAAGEVVVLHNPGRQG